MLFENNEKINKQKTLLDNRQPFMNRVGLAPPFVYFGQSRQVYLLLRMADLSAGGGIRYRVSRIEYRASSFIRRRRNPLTN